MGIHGVDEDEFMKKSTQMALYQSIKEADKTIYY